MTGRRLHEMHCDALKATEARRWDARWKRWNDERAYSPGETWPFLTVQQRNYWNDLARRVTPRKAKRST